VKLRILACFVFLLTPVAIGQGAKPENGFVPDSRTAEKIAEAVLSPVYGEKQIESERPFHAELRNGVWAVSGTLHCPDGTSGDMETCHGGVATVRIAKADAHILYMIHGK
jgi:hypothetical protein